ncbi:MAG TPA: condensation domain-containing protein, partial [Longimicrobiaceae bacterium]|nr:condensation domain-containing protein [Longimicrobiaceae bacterium]
MSKRPTMEDVYPLSPTQEGMLFHALSDQGGGVYVGQFGFRLAGELDEDAFRRAWQGVVDRHPALRTGFAWEKVDRPLQVVVRHAALPFRSEDWRGMPREEQEARLEAFLRADREEGFDLGKAPLIRLALFRLGDEAYRLVWTHHHMILDGWSLGLVYRDVLALYEACSGGREAALPRPRPYRDYVAWLKGRDLAAAERFWRGALAGFATPTPLGVGRPAEAAPGGRPESGRCALRLPRETTAAVHELARRGRLTPAAVVQGAWALLLSRYSGEEDVVFGSTVSGRPAELEGVEEMVGLFVATIPTRVRVAPDAPVLGWLEALHRRQGEAREHEHAPLVQVQAWSEVARGTPLFESCLSFQNYPVDPAAPTRGRFGVEDVWGLEVDDYPLFVAASPSGEEMVLDCTYHRGRLRAHEAERLLEHLGSVLAAFAGAPERPLREISVLAPGERERLLAQGAAADADFPRDALVHEVIAARAARWPD